MAIITNAGTLEYYQEATFGVFPTNPAMAWIGDIEKSAIKIDPGLEEVRSLKAAGATGTRLSPDLMAVAGESIDISIDALIQDWTFFQYLLSGSTPDSTPPVTLSGLSDTLKSVSLGLKSADSTAKYAKISGVKMSKWSINFPYKGFAKINYSLKGAHDNASSNDIWSTSDYIGSGSHASASTIKPLAYKNIKSVTWNGSAVTSSAVVGIKMECDRKIEGVPDPAATTSTKVGDFLPTDNDLKVTLSVKKGVTNLLTTDALSATAHDLVIVITGNEGSPVDQTFTFKNMYIPEENANLEGKGLASIDLQFIKGTDLALS